jgi:hypothetical protein
VGAVFRGSRIIHNHEIEFNLGKIRGVRELKRVKRIVSFFQLDLGQAGSIPLGAKETRHLLPSFVTKGDRINLVVPVQRRWNEDPVKAFFFWPIEVIDSPNEGHEMLTMILLPLNHFERHVKATLKRVI